MNSTKSNSHTPAALFAARYVLRRVRAFKEKALWGGEGRERILLRLLEGHYESLFRRLWTLGDEQPHFTHHRIGNFRFGYTEEVVGPEFFFRGFFSSEVLKPSDRVLDIGCGDGFFARRFFGPRCKSIDAVDIEPSAIEEAKRCNDARNIHYRLLDATSEPFPSPSC